MSSSRRERTRARILDAGNRLLLDRGYHGVGLEAVARAAGVTRQTVYDQFGSKSGLLGAMIARSEEVAGLPRQLQSVMVQIDGLAMLRAMLDAVAAVEPLVYPYSRVVYAARLDDPVAAEMWSARMTARRAGMGMVFARLGSDGRLRPGIGVEEAAEVAWALTSPFQYEFLVIERGWSVDRYRAHLEATIVARLLTGVEPQRGSRTSREAASPARRSPTRPAQSQSSPAE
jgi:AcrR family transcriptional regulator